MSNLTIRDSIFVYNVRACLLTAWFQGKREYVSISDIDKAIYSRHGLSTRRNEGVTSRVGIVQSSRIDALEHEKMAKPCHWKMEEW